MVGDSNLRDFHRGINVKCQFMPGGTVLHGMVHFFNNPTIVEGRTVIAILLGTNNVSCSVQEPDAILEEFKLLLSYLKQLVRGSGTKVLVMGLPPRADDIRLNQKGKEVNMRLQRLCKTMGVAFDQTYRTLNKMGNTRSLNMTGHYPGLHVTKEGKEAIAQRLRIAAVHTVTSACTGCKNIEGCQRCKGWIKHGPKELTEEIAKPQKSELQELFPEWCYHLIHFLGGERIHVVNARDLRY